MAPETVFDKIIRREIPAAIVAENDDVIVIKDISPKADIHLLIIPKVSVKDIQSLTPEQYSIGAAIFAMAKELSKIIPGAAEFKLVMNNGYSAGQRVFHMHAHFLAGAALPGIV